MTFPRRSAAGPAMTATAPAPSAARPDDADDFSGRRRRLHALLISPGPDLRHLTGLPRPGPRAAGCLVLRTEGQSRTGRARRGAALGGASPAGSMDVEIVPLERTTTSSLHPGSRRTGEETGIGCGS